MKSVLKLSFLLLAAAFVGTLLFALFFMRGGSGTFPALPTPNGYDDFIVAGNLVSSQTDDPYEMEFEPLRDFISTNQESLRLFHLGLTRTCSVHTAKFLTNQSTMSSDLMAIKRLARLGIAVGRLAEFEGRTNDAIAAYITGMRYGNEVSRGGFVIHRLVGVACEAMAHSRLTIAAVNLNATDSQGILKALEKLEAEAVTWAEIHATERMFIRESFRQSPNPIRLVCSWWSLRSMFKKAEAKHLSRIARRRLLLVDLALRSHVAAHGTPPQQLDDLVPEYLSRVPSDPFPERALIYRPAGTNWLLYSVGANRVDDGGTPVGRATGGNTASDDVRYDSK